MFVMPPSREIGGIGGGGIEGSAWCGRPIPAPIPPPNPEVIVSLLFGHFGQFKRNLNCDKSYLEVRDASDEERLPFLGRKDPVTDMNLMCKAPLEVIR